MIGYVRHIWSNVVINVTITILNAIYRLVFYLNNSISQTGFCLRLQVEPTRLSTIHKANLCPIMSRIVIAMLTVLRHHHHKPIDHIKYWLISVLLGLSIHT